MRGYCRGVGGIEGAVRGVAWVHCGIRHEVWVGCPLIAEGVLGGRGEYYVVACRCIRLWYGCLRQIVVQGLWYVA